MANAFWSAEKDKQLQRLEAAGLSAAKIAGRLGTTRNAVIGRSVRLRGLAFPSQREKQRRKRATRAERLREREERIANGLEQMRRTISKGVHRDIAIKSAAKAGATYEAIGKELGLTRQRVQQIVVSRRKLE
jgi:hypothetical protein